MQVAVYSISKNEEESAEQWSKTSQDADYRIVGDTGSSDKTVQILKDSGVSVYSLKINPWRFDDALNSTLSLIPDVDVCVRLDMDETMSSGWRTCLEKEFKKGFTKLDYPYVWSWQNNNRGLVFYRDHIHVRHGYRWVGPTHEALVWRKKNSEIRFRTDGLEVFHYPKNKNVPPDLSLLLEAVNERPHDPRFLFYLAREYYFHKSWNDCVTTFQKFLNLSQDKLERAYAYRIMSLCYGDNPPAVKYIWDSINEIPTKESYLHLGKCIPELKNWAEGKAKVCSRHHHWTEDPSVW